MNGGTEEPQLDGAPPPVELKFKHRLPSNQIFFIVICCQSPCGSVAARFIWCANYASGSAFLTSVFCAP